MIEVKDAIVGKQVIDVKKPEWKVGVIDRVDRTVIYVYYPDAGIYINSDANMAHYGSNLTRDDLQYVVDQHKLKLFLDELELNE